MTLAAWDANNGFSLRWGRLFIAAVVVAGIAFFASSASAQHVHPDETITDPKVAQFYSQWKRPPQRVVSCCNMKDCYSTKIRRSKTGGFEYFHKWSGTWADIPSGTLEENQKVPFDSPDIKSHVCAHAVYPTIVYCAVRGGGQ